MIKFRESGVRSCCRCYGGRYNDRDDGGGGDLSGGALEFSEGESLSRARGVSVFFLVLIHGSVGSSWLCRRRRSRFVRRAHDFSEG